jgi:sterol desaturase/sphingolipid hydroxylase (fatty acid hydroxylase superfamily)
MIREFQHLQLSPFMQQTVSIFGWLLLLLLVFVPLERLFAIRTRSVLRNALWIDLGYYLINNILPKLLLAVPIWLVARAAHHIVPYHLRLAVGQMPLGIRVAVSVVVLEIGFYWGHRWCHQIPFLWRFHAVHHSAEEIDWLTNTRAHPFDIAFTRLCGFIPLYALALVQPAGAAAFVPPFALIVVGVSWGFFIHSNLRWRFGWLEWLVSTPAFHHWHHTNDEHRDRNFAPLFPWIDMLFGTFYLPRRAWPNQYGIDAAISPSLAGQLLDPLIPRINRDIRAAPVQPSA